MRHGSPSHGGTTGKARRVRRWGMQFETPPALDPGDTVGLVAPSESRGGDRVTILRRRLRERFDLGLRTFETVDRDAGNPRVHPAERAADLERAFRADDVDAVMAVTGGDDQIRVLRHLDPDVLKDNPKRFFGYSDNDNLRLLLWNLGLVSYGVQMNPDLVVGDELHDYTARYLRRAFFEEAIGEVEPAAEWTDEWYDFEDGGPRDWRPNDGWQWRGDRRVAGPVWGGCASILSWQLQTDRYLPEPAHLDGAVLAVETSETLPRAAEVGYLLRSMGERGLLERFDGVLVGRPRAYSPTVERDPDFEPYRRAIREAVTTQLDRYAPDATAAFDVDFGHTEPIFPLPLGATATLDPGEGRITFD